MQAHVLLVLAVFQASGMHTVWIELHPDEFQAENCCRGLCTAAVDIWPESAVEYATNHDVLGTEQQQDGVQHCLDYPSHLARGSASVWV